MPRYLLDLEVESHGTLVDGLAELQSRGSGIAAFVKSREAKPGAGNTILELQLLFDAASIAGAKERGLDVAKEFLRSWAFTTSMSF